MQKILVIDDNELMREIVGECVQSVFQGPVLLAGSGPEGMTKLMQETFSIVVCDFDMPEKNGLDVLRFVREKSLPVKFILFTGRESLSEFYIEDDVHIVLNKDFQRLINCLVTLA